MKMQRKVVVIELLISHGAVSEYRRQHCHKTNVELVRRKLGKSGLIIGSCVTDVPSTDPHIKK